MVVHVEDQVLAHDGQPDQGDVGDGLGLVRHLVAFDCTLEVEEARESYCQGLSGKHCTMTTTVLACWNLILSHWLLVKLQRDSC